jgi:excisionase family DNA binding protein
MSDTPWMTVQEVSAYMRLSTKTIYRLAASGQLKASRATGRKALRFLRQWCDDYLMTMAEPVGREGASTATDHVSI